MPPPRHPPIESLPLRSPNSHPRSVRFDRPARSIGRSYRCSRLAGSRHAASEARVAEQRLGRGVAPAEVAVDLRRVAATAEAEHSLTEATADRADLLVVVEAGLLERSERVGREDLGPLVRIVPCRVATGEDVPERAQEAVLLERRHNRVLLRHLRLHLERRRSALRARVVAVVQVHVEGAEVELAEHDHAGQVGLLLVELGEEVTG
mmetsp:Transcript_11525/g.26657  ORF Transcript_11525/g.26657 Transcript_11525/m.26657 type:complete len:207 (-) Transcript_11525:1675-2295(-)